MNNYLFRGQGQSSVPVYQNPFQQPTPTNDIKWVQGDAGARAFPVSAGATVQLMDTEAPVFYIKTVDVSGMPLPLRTFDYSERIPKEDKDDRKDYVTRLEFDELKKQFDDLIGGN